MGDTEATSSSFLSKHRDSEEKKSLSVTGSIGQNMRFGLLVFGDARESTAFFLEVERSRLENGQRACQHMDDPA